MKTEEIKEWVISHRGYTQEEVKARELIISRAAEEIEAYHKEQMEEVLVSAICQFTKRNTQSEIQEVHRWIEKEYLH